MMQRYVFDVTSLPLLTIIFFIGLTNSNINSHPIYIFSDDGFDEKIREITADKSGIKEVKVKNILNLFFHKEMYI